MTQPLYYSFKNSVGDMSIEVTTNDKSYFGELYKAQIEPENETELSKSFDYSSLSKAISDIFVSNSFQFEDFKGVALAQKAPEIEPENGSFLKGTFIRGMLTGNGLVRFENKNFYYSAIDLRAIADHLEMFAPHMNKSKGETQGTTGQDKAPQGDAEGEASKEAESLHKPAEDAFLQVSKAIGEADKKIKEALAISAPHIGTRTKSVTEAFKDMFELFRTRLDKAFKDADFK